MLARADKVIEWLRSLLRVLTAGFGTRLPARDVRIHGESRRGKRTILGIEILDQPRRKWDARATSVNAMLRFPSAPWLRPLLPPRGSWRRQAENRPRHAGRKLGVRVGAFALPRKGTRRTLTGFPSHSRVACWGPQQPFACRGKIERTRHSSSFVLHDRAISRPQRSRCDARHNFDD